MTKPLSRESGFLCFKKFRGSRNFSAALREGLLFIQVSGWRTLVAYRGEDTGHVPVRFADAAAEEGDEYFHQHFAVIYGAVHGFGGDFERELPAHFFEHVREVAEFVALELRQDRL